jgi:hypothetical protein
METDREYPIRKDKNLIMIKGKPSDTCTLG